MNKGDHIEILEKIIENPTRYSPESIADELGHDPWFYNRALNAWEYAMGKERLSSYPLDLSITCVSNACNANCAMCRLKKGQPFFTNGRIIAKRYGELLPYCTELGLVGWGEPLLNPHLKSVFRKLEEYCDPRCNIYMSTNGILLKKRIDIFQNVIKNINVSLNAASQKIHEKVMGVDGELKTVLEGIEQAIKNKERFNHTYQVNISVITNSLNIHEIPEIIRLSESLGADSVIIRPLHDYSVNAFRENRHDSSYHSLHPETLSNYDLLRNDVVDSIKDARMKIISTDPRFSSDSFESIYVSKWCFRPFTSMVLYQWEDKDIVQPCCFLSDNKTSQNIDFPVIEGDRTAIAVWNSSFYRKFRQRLINSRISPECKKCRTKM